MEFLNSTLEVSSRNSAFCWYVLQIAKTSSNKFKKPNDFSSGDKIIKLDYKISIISEVNLHIFSKVIQNS